MAIQSYARCSILTSFICLLCLPKFIGRHILPESRFTFIKNVNFCNSLLWSHAPLQPRDVVLCLNSPSIYGSAQKDNHIDAIGAHDYLLSVETEFPQSWNCCNVLACCFCSWKFVTVKNRSPIVGILQFWKWTPKGDQINSKGIQSCDCLLFWILNFHYLEIL